MFHDFPWVFNDLNIFGLILKKLSKVCKISYSYSVDLTAEKIELKWLATKFPQ